MTGLSELDSAVKRCFMISALLAALCAASPPRAFGGDDATCLVATVRAESITVADVHELQAILQPPPDDVHAGRLALDVALAHLWAYGYVAPASAKARVEAYRELLARARTTTPEESAANAVMVLERLKRDAGVELGPCYVPIPTGDLDARPASLPSSENDVSKTFERLSRQNETKPLVHAVQLFLPASAGSDPAHVVVAARLLEDGASDLPSNVVYTDLGLFAPDRVDADFGEAVFALDVSETSAPIHTRFGVHVVRVLERFQPRALTREDVARILAGDSRKNDPS